MAALDPCFAKDTVVTPGPDRRGEAEMSHACLLNRTVQGTDDHWKNNQPLHLDQARSARLGSVE
jgi:hypothetical protein